MTKYSPVAPVGILEQLHEEAQLDDYLLLLAHDVLEEPRRYTDLLAYWRMVHGEEATVIMDNGTIEKGSPVLLTELLEAASLAEADVVVGPDIVGDFGETKKLMMEQGDTIRESYKMMLIPQGETIEEVCECIRWMDERFLVPGEQWWGIPRWFANEFGSRQTAINYINNYARGMGTIKIHLLGMSNNIKDDLRCCKTLSVVGIDSANPLVLGYLHESMEDPDRDQHPERGNFWESDNLHPMITDNVKWMHNAVSK